MLLPQTHRSTIRLVSGGEVCFSSRLLAICVFFSSTTPPSFDSTVSFTQFTKLIPAPDTWANLTWALSSTGPPGIYNSSQTPDSQYGVYNCA